MEAAAASAAGRRDRACSRPAWSARWWRCRSGIYGSVHDPATDLSITLGLHATRSR